MRVYSNLAISIDGKISSFDRKAKRFASDADRTRMEELRFEADAVIHGAGTVREHPHPILIKNQEFIKRRQEQGKSPHPLNVILSHSLDLPFPSKFFQSEETAKLIYTVRSANKEKLKKLSPYSELVIFQEDKIDPKRVVEDLGSRKVHSLLIEGGGELMASFLKANLINEMFVTVCPLIFGGKLAPTLVDGEGFLLPEAPRLQLLDSKVVNEELFLHYKVVHKGFYLN